ncbi:hypothetical protein [Kribbella sp. NPDC051137]|uniref:hypothetical protein n=1 Tax=Kribbella sp. NPDC051137 TaxID=3155045 RepID=UPI0034226327
MEEYVDGDEVTGDEMSESWRFTPEGVRRDAVRRYREEAADWLRDNPPAAGEPSAG